MNTYWHVNDLRKFNNVMIHQLAGDLKYLSCLSCQSSILGYQIISQPDQIFVSCDRVKLENEMDEEDDGGQYQEEFGGQQQYEEGQYTESQMQEIQEMQYQQQLQMQQEHGAMDGEYYEEDMGE